MGEVPTYLSPWMITASRRVSYCTTLMRDDWHIGTIDWEISHDIWDSDRCWPMALNAR